MYSIGALRVHCSESVLDKRKKYTLTQTFEASWWSRLTCCMICTIWRIYNLTLYSLKSRWYKILHTTNTLSRQVVIKTWNLDNLIGFFCNHLRNIIKGLWASENPACTGCRSLVVVLSLSKRKVVSSSPAHAGRVKPKMFKIGSDCSFAKRTAFRR
jgi:hypothetical protein